MSASASKFTLRSREVVEGFLQSAVIVDDQAEFDSQPGPVVTPGRRQAAPSESESERPSSESTHDLDAGSLIDAFADLGVVCAVLKPRLIPDSADNNGGSDALKSLEDRTDKATNRADIVIVDWNIPEEQKPGQNAKHLIQEILRTDDSGQIARRGDHSRRLRLIAIYTGDENLETITTEAKVLLEALELGEISSRRYCVRAGPVAISVYGKGAPTIQASDVDRRVSERELPGRLRDDFAEMTQGLLSNAALESLSAIRTNTHRILRRFDRSLDPAYIAHRAMMQPPEEAEEHPIPLIASEIEGVLADDPNIPKLVRLEAIGEWIEQLPLGAEAQFGMDSEEFRRVLISLLKKGLGGAETPPGPWKKLVKELGNYKRSAASKITNVLSEDGVDGAELDMRFALLTSLRSRYETPTPLLRLGSIVTTNDSQSPIYLLCIQPLCDSVRLERARKFPFLRLEAREESSGGAFDLIVEEGGKLKRLYVSRKAYDIRVILMQPDPNSQRVEASVATNSSCKWEFRNAEGPPLRWLGDLKPDFAHRIVNEFASDVARVGLSESEWLRRMAKNR